MNYISLFDYLGKAAGPALGERVNIYSQIRKQPLKQREISNPAYKGKVCLYKKSFLRKIMLYLSTLLMTYQSSLVKGLSRMKSVKKLTLIFFLMIEAIFLSHLKKVFLKNLD